jgi:hypothetical protein
MACITPRQALPDPSKPLTLLLAHSHCSMSRFMGPGGPRGFGFGGFPPGGFNLRSHRRHYGGMFFDEPTLGKDVRDKVCGSLEPGCHGGQR